MASREVASCDKVASCNRGPGADLGLLAGGSQSVIGRFAYELGGDDTCVVLLTGG